MQFLHCLSGEDVLTVTDYRKHYHAGFPHLIDSARTFEKDHNTNGWPFYMIVDGKGIVVFKKTTIIERDEEEITGTLDAVATGKPLRFSEFRGTRYLEEIQKKRGAEKIPGTIFSSYCLDKEGKGYECNTEHGDGENRICVTWGKQTVSNVNAHLKDAYYGVVVPDDQGGFWSFFSALSDTGNYDIFARHFNEKGYGSEPENLTLSNDDAMHPDAVKDHGGNIWVTYYRWHKMGIHSRDKEIYARFFDGKSWSRELRLTPEDLPVYEDHTDPSITAHPEGGVVVAWSWDMHRSSNKKYQRYQTIYHAESPTIFGRRATADKGVGDLLILGSVDIDNKPELFTASDKRIWCAWNTLNFRSHRKSLHVSYLEPGEKDYTEQFTVEQGVEDITNPRFLEQGGKLRLAWCSQDEKGAWRLKCSTLDNESWSEPKIIEKVADPRALLVYLNDSGKPSLKVYPMEEKPFEF